MIELAEENDAPKVVGVVGGKAFELLADGHNSGWFARRGRAADQCVEPGGVAGGCSGLPVAVKKALAKLLPAFTLYIFLRWEA